MNNNNLVKNFNLNNFLGFINLKKQYFKNLENMKLQLTKKNRIFVKDSSMILNNSFGIQNGLVTYIVDVKFTRSNTLVHVADFSGNLKFFYSAGLASYKGKNKKARYTVFRDLYRMLISKLVFLSGKPIALHLTNVAQNKKWLVKQLKKKFFIVSVRSFNRYPHNGCRKRKIRRKKFKK